MKKRSSLCSQRHALGGSMWRQSSCVQQNGSCADEARTKRTRGAARVGGAGRGGGGATRGGRRGGRRRERGWGVIHAGAHARARTHLEADGVARQDLLGGTRGVVEVVSRAPGQAGVPWQGCHGGAPVRARECGRGRPAWQAREPQSCPRAAGAERASGRWRWRLRETAGGVGGQREDARGIPI